MSHNVEHYTYAATKSKMSIENRLNDYVSQCTWQEGGGGLPQSIRWLNEVCDGREEAEQYLEKHDKGWYDQVAVRFRDRPEGKPTKKLQELQKKYKEVYQKYEELNNKVAFNGYKAQYVGCKNCGSKLSTKYLKRNACPLCGAEMRAQTTLEAIAKLRTKAQEIQKAINTEIARMRATNQEKGDIMWLVKIEYHT